MGTIDVYEEDDEYNQIVDLEDGVIKKLSVVNSLSNCIVPSQEECDKVNGPAVMSFDDVNTLLSFLNEMEED